MKTKLQFKVSIQAPVAKVYDLMLGITNKATYEAWTAMFNPTSSYEGSWNKGSRMYFVGIDEKGEKGGMVADIVEHQPHQFVSIKHIGMLQAGKEILDGPEVEKWSGGFENYTFVEENNATILQIDLEITPDFADYMNETYPNALNKLKEICEG